MPAIHGSLSDKDFDKFGEIAKSRGMERSDLVTALALAEVHKLSNAIKTTTAEGTPIIPQYERAG
jgi:hypothetical protein